MSGVGALLDRRRMMMNKPKDLNEVYNTELLLAQLVREGFSTDYYSAYREDGYLVVRGRWEIGGLATRPILDISYEDKQRYEIEFDYKTDDKTTSFGFDITYTNGTRQYIWGGAANTDTYYSISGQTKAGETIDNIRFIFINGGWRHIKNLKITKI